MAKIHNNRENINKSYVKLFVNVIKNGSRS